MKHPGSLKMVTALLAGVVAGTVLGLLFAPAKGTELRKKAIDGAKDLADNLKNSVGSLSLPGRKKEATGNTPMVD